MRFRQYIEVIEPQMPDDVTWRNPPPTEGDSRATFRLGDEEYRVDFETYTGKLSGQNVKGVSINFGTLRKGVFPTHGNVPFQALSRVFGIIKDYIERTNPEVIDFYGESWKLRLLYERLAIRFLTGKYVNPKNVSSMFVRIDTAQRVGMDGVAPGGTLGIHKKAVADENRKKQENRPV
jgi:hypothetical protein